jgi:2'-5' RNA ligase
LGTHHVIRAFIAVEIDPLVLERIDQATHDLSTKIPDIRWAARPNWHLTLKFLGAIDEKQADAIGQVLEREVSLFPRCTINAKGLGVFPDTKRPRVLWVGVEGQGVAALAEKIEIALAPLGFKTEQRAFTPHLTIGRWREGKHKNLDLDHVLEHWRSYDFGPSSVNEVKLFQSILKPTGAQYRPLKNVLLKNVER